MCTTRGERRYIYQYPVPEGICGKQIGHFLQNETGRNDARRSFVTFLHTSGWTMLKLISMQNLIQIYYVVQESALTTTGQTDAQQSIVHQERLLRRPVARQCRHAYVCKILPRYLCGLRVMSILLTAGHTDSHGDYSAHLRVTRVNS